MSTEIEKVWNDLKQVKAQFAPTLSDTEFNFFVGLGQGLKANPFTREIWAVKYGTAPASIFLGRDFYRKKAQEQPDYDGHYAEAVYSNDTFSVENGHVKHSFKLSDRGNLLAAYCIVKRKGISQPYYVLVNFAEYDLKQSLWKTKPETQLKKVAESQALRGAYQGVFAGTYDESEQYEPSTAVQVKPVEITPNDPQYKLDYMEFLNMLRDSNLLNQEEYAVRIPSPDWKEETYTRAMDKLRKFKEEKENGAK